MSRNWQHFIAPTRLVHTLAPSYIHCLKLWLTSLQNTMNESWASRAHYYGGSSLIAILQVCTEFGLRNTTKANCGPLIHRPSIRWHAQTIQYGTICRVNSLTSHTKLFQYFISCDGRELSLLRSLSLPKVNSWVQSSWIIFFLDR
jgi:hypothetical protein